MLSIQQMQYIVALSEEQQFQKASERCFVTQPTLSMQIKKAEEELGHLIFDRSSSPLKLTNFGINLLPILREILSENEKIKLLKDKQNNQFVEEIRLGVIPTIAHFLVPSMFGIWQNELENVKLSIEELKTTELIEALERKEIDLAILAGPHYDPRLRTIPLFNEEILIYCPSIEGSEISLEELQNLHPWLLSKGNCLRTQMIHFCKLNDGVSDAWNYQGGNIDLLTKMVDQNGGYTLVPENIDLEGKTENLKHLTSSLGVPAREIIGLYPERSIKKESVERILREIQFKYSTNRKLEHYNLLSWK
jgi:LysR family hydrogen peroxide-inducible transcriptional activator